MKKIYSEKIAQLFTKSLEFKNIGDLVKSENTLKRVLKLEPNNSIALNNLGNIYSQRNDLNKAIIFYSKAVSIKKDYSNAIFNLALTSEEIGKKNDAIKLYKNAIRYDPDNLAFYHNLSRIDETIFLVKSINLIKKILKNKDCSNFNKSSGFFILAYDQRRKRNIKKEIEYLIQAHKFFLYSNEKIHNQISFFWIRLMPKIIKKFDFELEHTQKQIKPIFIVGLPRSGSTLIESILCSGKKIIPNGGETAIIHRTFMDVSKNFFVQKKFLIDAEKLNINEKSFVKKANDQYKLLNLTNKDNVFTDKSLENFFYIELIIKFFPNSKIIICKRNILQIIISIYQNFLPKIKWSHSIDNILEYIDNYFKIIDNFEKKYPNKMHIIELEKLIKDPINSSKDLFNFCNLEWDKKCLEFYKRDDLISKTASNVQVRSKIFSADQKKNIAYKEFLQPYASKYEWLKVIL